jgi:hypothetical protein
MSTPDAAQHWRTEMLNTDNAATYALSLFTGAELVSSVIEIEGGSELATVVLMVPYEGAMVEEIVSVWINEDNRIYGEC